MSVEPQPGERTVPGLLRVAQGINAPAEMSAAVDRYQGYFGGESEHARREYAAAVNTYFDLVTDFYEYGWGQSFHFAPRARGETFREAILRHEQYLALRLGLSPESHVLDVGCGVGGPMRTIARFAGCHITGLNNNSYQIERAHMHNRRAGLTARCEIVKGDFMAMPFPDASFDAAYALEALVHAPDLAGVYAEIRRVLKPGGLVASYEWAMTRQFDASNPAHEQVRRGIAATNGVLHLSTTDEVAQAVAAAGLELVQFEDRGADSEIPWWEPLAPPRNPLALRRSSGIGRHFTTIAVRVLEALRIAPRGSATVARMLDRAAQALVRGGMEEIFTPALLVVARRSNSAE